MSPFSRNYHHESIEVEAELPVATMHVSDSAGQVVSVPRSEESPQALFTPAHS